MKITIIILVIVIAISFAADLNMAKGNERHWKGMYEGMQNDYILLMDYICEVTDEKTKFKILEYAQKQHK